MAAPKYFWALRKLMGNMKTLLKTHCVFTKTHCVFIKTHCYTARLSRLKNNGRGSHTLQRYDHSYYSLFIYAPTFRAATMTRRNLLHRRTQRTGLVAARWSWVAPLREKTLLLLLLYVIVIVHHSCFSMPDHVHLLGATTRGVGLPTAVSVL